MSDVPPTPPSTPMPLPPAPVDPQKAVQLPAIGLMVMGGLYILWILYLIGSSVLGLAIGAGGGDRLGFLLSGIGMVVGIIFNLLIAGLLFYGAMQMKNLRNYNLAMAAAIAAIVPCNYCCCIGIGVGIWALVVLMKPEVKAAFTK